MTKEKGRNANLTFKLENVKIELVAYKAGEEK